MSGAETVPLPEPGHYDACYGGGDYWTRAQVEAYGQACADAERDAVARFLDQQQRTFGMVPPAVLAIRIERGEHR